MQLSKNFSLTERNLADAEPSPHSYAQFKFDEASGLLLNDATGNGNNLSWITSGANATPPVDMWQPGFLQYGNPAVADDAWGAVDADSFPFANMTYSSLYFLRIKTTAARAGATQILCKAGAGSGNDIYGGFRLYINPTGGFQVLITHGAGTAAGASTVAALTIDEEYTCAAYYDAATNTIGVAVVSDVTAATPILRTAAGSGISYNLGTTTPALGQRGVGNATDLLSDCNIYMMDCYHDVEGGALPANLADILKWKHFNQDTRIPADWWA